MLPPISIAIAGAQRAGTTSLTRYLGQHPSIVSQRRLEFTYFVDDLAFSRGYEANIRDQFPTLPRADQVLLVKSVGIMFLEKAAKRLNEHNPGCHVIVVLRDPVARAYSAYWYLRRAGAESAPTFEEALSLEDARMQRDFARYHDLAYLRRGEYVWQIEMLQGFFGEAQVHVVFFEDLTASPQTVVEGLMGRLGLPIIPLSIDISRENPSTATRSRRIASLMRRRPRIVRHLAHLLPGELRASVRDRALQRRAYQSAPPPIDPETARSLRRRFEPSVRELEQLLGRDLAAWK